MFSLFPLLTFPNNLGPRGPRKSTLEHQRDAMTNIERKGKSKRRTKNKVAAKARKRNRR